MLSDIVQSCHFSIKIELYITICIPTLIIHYSTKLNRDFINILITNLLATEPILTISVPLTVIVGSLNLCVNFARLDGISALTRMRRFPL